MLLYNLPQSKAEFHLVLSLRILSFSSRRGSVCFRYALVLSIAFKFSLFVIIIRIVLAASKPSLLSYKNNRSDENRLSSQRI